MKAKCCENATRIVDNNLVFRDYCRTHGSVQQGKRIPDSWIRPKWKEAYLRGLEDSRMYGLTALVAVIKRDTGLSLRGALEQAYFYLGESGRVIGPVDHLGKSR